MGKPVVYFEIAGRDGEALKEFYANLFDWNISHHAPAGSYWYVEGEEGGIPDACSRRHGPHRHVSRSVRQLHRPAQVLSLAGSWPAWSVKASLPWRKR